MDRAFILELVGYLASILIIFSIVQRSILKLRLVGLVGSAAFVVYGLLIRAYPIAAANIVIGLIHLYYLRHLIFRQTEVFSVLHVNPQSNYLQAFLDFHADDVARYFGGDFPRTVPENGFAAFLLRDTVPAGLFVGSQEGSTINVVLDYVTPQYRDFKLGTYLYSAESGLFTDRAVSELAATTDNREHAAYLERVGFTHQGSGRYVRELS